MRTRRCIRACLLLLPLLALGAAVRVEAQSFKRNAVHAEALGPAILGSANYERFLAESLSMRAGIGFFPGLDWGAVLSPVLLNGFVGRGTHRLELGAGFMLWYRIPYSESVERPVTPSFLDPSLTGTVAYRFQSRAGAIFRAGFTPVSTGGSLFPTVAVSAGLAF